MNSEFLYKCPDGRKTPSFKDVFYENMVVESPNVIPTYESMMDSIQYNKEETRDTIIKYYDYAGNFGVSGNPLDIYKHEYDNIIEYYLVSSDKEFYTVAINRNEKISDGVIQFRLTWNLRGIGRGVFRSFFKNYLIKNYNRILSDENITKFSRNFWEEMVVDFNESDNKYHTVFIYDKSKKEDIEIKNNSDIPDDFYGNTNYLFGMKNYE